MTYSKVINNEITEHNRTLPFSTETTSFGVGTSAETLKSFGYLPVIGIEPEYDRLTHRVANVSYVVGTNEVIKTYEVVAIPQEEIIATTVKAMEEAIETHINTTVKAKGYNSQDSIAKYLVSGNPFEPECKAISLWIGSVWIYAHQVQADVLAGTRTMPTLEELIAELPKLA